MAMKKELPRARPQLNPSTPNARVALRLANRSMAFFESLVGMGTDGNTRQPLI